MTEVTSAARGAEPTTDRSPTASMPTDTGTTGRTDPGLGALAVLGALTAAVAILSLDVVLGSGMVRGRGLRSLTISEYVYTDGAWAFNLGVVAVAVGSAALLIALVRSGWIRWGSAGSVFLALWAIGLAGIVAFPKHDWSAGPSASGSIHRVASLVAFIALPIAVLLIVRRRQRRESRAASAAFWLALGGLAFLGVLIGAIVVGAVNGGSWWRIIPLGLVERGLAGFEVAAVLAMGVWLVRGPRRLLTD